MPDIVIVDRSRIFTKPDYCIHGTTTCYNCGHDCWLGDQTIKTVLAGAYPLCLDCANEFSAQGLLPEPKHVEREHVQDHRRADGPH
jgi:hypothetical protein